MTPSSSPKSKAFLAFFLSLASPIHTVIANPYPTEIAQKSSVAAEEAYEQGLRLYQEGTTASLRQSIIEWEKALQLWQQQGDQSQQALILLGIGRAYNALEENQQALEYYNLALSLYRTVGDQDGEALTLHSIGFAYNALGENQQALEYYKQALSLYSAVGDHDSKAAALYNIASIYKAWGENQQALEYYNQVLLLVRTLKYRDKEADTLNNIGLTYKALGENQQALEYYNQALSLYLTIGDRNGEANILNNIGRVYSDLGEKQQALEYYNRAMPIFRTVGDQDGEASTLNNIGAAYDGLGEKQQALEYYNQALPLRQAVGDRQGEATTLNNIGSVYDILGEKQQALAYYNQALTLRRAVGDRQGEAITLNNIGGIYNALGEKQQALEYYNQALPLFLAVENRSGEASILNNLGGIYSDLGEKQQALEYYNRALPLYLAVEDQDGEAVTLNNIGLVYYNLGEKQRGLEYYNQALSLYRAVKNRSGEANTLRNIAVLQYEQNNLLPASESMEQAIENIEFLRNQILTPRLQTSFFLTVEEYYDFQIRLLMELHQKDSSQGYHSQALYYSERIRARQLLTELQEARVDIRQGVDPKLVQAEKASTKQLATALEEQAQLLRGSYRTKEQANLNQEINSLVAELDQIETTIRLQSPAYAAINQPTKFTLQTREIQEQVLDDDTLLLEYHLSEQGSYLWVVSKDKVSSYELPPQAEIEQLANKFRNDMASETINNPEIVKQLSKIILGPAVQELGNKRLLIVGDGTLQSIPFAALPLPNSLAQKPLIANHEIITLPSASSLEALRQQVKGRPLAPKQLAVFADPVYELEGQQTVDLRDLTRSAQNVCLSLPNLQYTRTEAENILALVPENESFAAFGYDASLATATSPQLSQYQTVHFSTHGCLNKDVPQFSGLALSVYNSQGELQDPLLRLDTIYNLELPAELVVLSACETGLGSELAGEGLVSLTRGFMYAGAKRVVVSLWAVNDRSTSELMSTFYKKMYQEKLKPAAALREAQLEMWQKDSNWQDPYYWAAFTIQGEQ